jgi:phosphoglycerate dehydrogenase-like enzyme
MKRRIWGKGRDPVPQKEICVLFIWQPEKKLRTYLEKGLSEYPVHCIFPPDTAEETFLELAPQADIIVGWRPTKKLLLAAEQLTLYINPGAGVQHLVNLFKEITRERPVVLVNGHGNAYFTAQHAAALLLALTNRIIPHHNWMVQGEWRKGDADAISIPLRNRKVGLLGYGHVNRQVHRFLSGFDIEFAAVRQDWGNKIIPVKTPLKKYGYTELHPFLEEVDTLIVSVPLTSLTRNFIKMKELELLGKGGLLVNVARGPVIEELSLYTALKDKIIAGAALDVWYNYSPDPDEKGRKYPFTYPFHELDNIVLSPHRAASPLNDLKRWDEVIENIRRVSRGEKEFLNVVDLEKEY